MTSRFVNLVVKHMNGRQAPFSIHRINPKSLFFATGSTVRTPCSSELATVDDIPLPPAQISFECPLTAGQDSSMDFMAFGRNRDKIVAMDGLGHTFLYDAGMKCFRGYIPDMPHRLMKPMSIAVGDDGLFVMSDRKAQFVALMDGINPSSTYLTKPNWYWQPLPRPPFASSSCDPCKISAYTVVASKLWVSVGTGTFSFDPESGAWKKAGDWALPFRGRVDYVPEHNLWFGFSDKDEQLCASDLTAVSMVRPPVPQKLWKDLVWQEDWKLMSTYLLPLGSGKLCIARFFLTSDEADDMYKPAEINNFVVLAGVQVVSDEGRLRFIKHKSVRYSFGQDFADPL